MLVSLTVGKVDAGVAVLLTQDNRLIEFPSVLLPSNITSGSIVDITVARNQAAEAASASAFQSLQKRILNTYGVKTPSPPVLRLRNATQTSLVLEWDPIDLATASLKSLSLYRNGSKAGSIPRPLETRSTKISGLAIHSEYDFRLVLRTTAGTYTSDKLVCRTHKMTDLSGITVTAGIMPPQQKDALGAALDRIGGKLIDTVRIDTTHFVCTEGRGPLWEKAVEMNIPVVVPEWVDACESEGTIVSVRGYYLNADPKTRQLGPIHGSTQRQRTNSGATVAQSVLSQSRPSTQPTRETEQQVEAATTAQNQGQDQDQDQEPPTTPFPGQHMNIPPRTEENEVSAEEDDDSSPPPPPPKDDEEQGKPEERAEQNGDKDIGADGDAEEPESDSKDKDEDTPSENKQDGPPEQASDQEGKEEKADESSGSEGKKAKGEGDFNEVSLE